MSLSHNHTLQLTHACISQQFLKTILVVWNWGISLIHSAPGQSTWASNEIVFVTPSKMAAWWFKRSTQPFNWPILSQNLCLTHGLSTYDGYSWVGDSSLILHASCSLFTTCFLFRIAVFVCICHSLLLRGHSAQGSPNPSPTAMV